MKLVTVSQMQKIEKEADAGGLTYDHMMQNAGQGLAEVLIDLFIEEEEKEAVGLVGPGNNGGDTLVALTALAKEVWSSVLRSSSYYLYCIKCREKEIDRRRESFAMTH